MTDEQNNIFIMKDFYLLKSAATKRAYLDDDGSIYLFESEDKGKDFVTQTERTMLSDKMHLTNDDLMGLALSGAKLLKVILNDHEEDISVLEGEFPLDPKLISSNSLFYRFFQTGNKQYFRQLLTETFFIPVSLPARKDGHYPYISYMFASQKDRTYLTVFTNLREFNAWNDNQEKKCEALGLTLKQIVSDIRKNVSLIFNPETDKRTLTSEQISRASNKPTPVKSL